MQKNLVLYRGWQVGIFFPLNCVYIYSIIVTYRRWLFVSLCCYTCLLPHYRVRTPPLVVSILKGRRCAPSRLLPLSRLRFIFYQFYLRVHIILCRYHAGAVVYKQYYKYCYVEFRPSCSRTRFTG